MYLSQLKSCLKIDNYNYHNNYFNNKTFQKSISPVKYLAANSSKPMDNWPFSATITGYTLTLRFCPFGILTFPVFKSNLQLCHGHLTHNELSPISSMSPRWRGPPVNIHRIYFVNNFFNQYIFTSVKILNGMTNIRIKFA